MKRLGVALVAVAAVLAVGCFVLAYWAFWSHPDEETRNAIANTIGTTAIFIILPVGVGGVAALVHAWENP